MKNSQVFKGILLLGAGVLMLLANLEVLSGLWFLYALSLGFLTAYFFLGRNLGFLIPGNMIGAIAIFASLNERFIEVSPAWLFVFFAAAFFIVYFIHTRNLETSDRGERIWPLFPGTALLLVGILVYVVESQLLDARNLRYINYIFPVALILIGFTVLVKGVSTKSR